MVQKAYTASISDGWCALVHGETPGQAKMRFMGSTPEVDEFIAMRLQRIPGLDDKPFTYENAKAVAFEYWNPDTGEPAGPELFDNICFCEICNANRMGGRNDLNSV